MAGLQMVYHVVVEGTIGAGKSTLVNNIHPLLATHFGNSWIVPEPINHWLAYGSSKENVLKNMYTNPKQYSFLFQVVASVTKVKELVEVNQEVKGVKIAERSLEAQSKVFIPNLSHKNMLTIAEKEVLEEMIELMLLQNGVKPDLILYLQASPESVMKRIRMRNRTEENGITLEYLSELHERYENWLTDPEIKTPVIIINAEDITTVMPENVVKQIVQSLEK